MADSTYEFVSKSIYSQADVEAFVDAKLKEHAATLETTLSDQINQVPRQDEDYTLSAKQIEYALRYKENLNWRLNLPI